MNWKVILLTKCVIVCLPRWKHTRARWWRDVCVVPRQRQSPFHQLLVICEEIKGAEWVSLCHHPCSITGDFLGSLRWAHHLSRFSHDICAAATEHAFRIHLCACSLCVFVCGNPCMKFVCMLCAASTVSQMLLIAANQIRALSREQTYREEWSECVCVCVSREGGSVGSLVALRGPRRKARGVEGHTPAQPCVPVRDTPSSKQRRCIFVFASFLWFPVILLDVSVIYTWPWGRLRNEYNSGQSPHPVAHGEPWIH